MDNEEQFEEMGIWAHPVADGNLALSMCDGERLVTLGINKAEAFKWAMVLLNYSTG